MSVPDYTGQMKHIGVLAVLAVSGIAAAQVGWYGGDMDETGEFIICGQFDGGADARAYEDFVWNSSSPAISAWVNMTSSFVPTTALVEIRTGMAPGNGGTLLHSEVCSTNVVVHSGGTSTGPYMTVNALFSQGVNLAMGSTYWFSVTPIGSGSDSAALATTLGSNGYGSPLMNSNALFNYPGGGFNYAAGSTLLTNPNFSMGITAVPEPSSMVAVLLGAAFLRRRNRQAS